MQKSIDAVQIDLVQSTLGVHHPGLGKVAFAPGALRLRVEFDVSSCGSCSTLGNGPHIAIVQNQDYVFADYSGGTLSIDHDFQLQSGTANLDITVDQVEYPPEAKHDLGATETCDDPGGLVLDASRSLSGDPDDDIASEYWWVDGEPCAHGCVVPFGSHTIAIEAEDDRGAVARSDDFLVYVATSHACTP